ncbi:unnamed protein product, partial [Tenebrio molitor]
YEDFLVVQDDEWEEECFKMTTVESGNPLKKNIENVVYFCDEDDKQERWYKQIKSRYPELEEVQELSEGKDVTIHLRGLDSMTTKEEVKESVIATGLIKRKERLMVKALRPAYGESQTATITAIEEDARRIIKEGTVRVGLSLCAAQERLDLEKCYRCWAFDHKTVGCKGPDRRNACYKCGKVGHLAKECQNNLECPLCQEVGHRAGEGRCTKFRAALTAQRKKARSARSSKDGSEHNRPNQTNLNRSRAAMNLFYKTVEDRGISIAVISEPNKKMVQNLPSVIEECCDVAVIVIDRNVQVHKCDSTKCFVCCHVEDIVIYGCYISPNIELSEFKIHIRDLMLDIRRAADRDVIVCGDFNAKSHLWGSPIEDERGAIIVEWLAAEDLVVMNEGGVPTFERGGSSSFIDITMANGVMSRRIQKWTVTAEENLSDHKNIEIDILKKKSEREEPQAGNGARWKYEPSRMPRLLSRLGQNYDKEKSGRTPVEAFMTALKNATSETLMKAHTGKHRRKPVYWWNDEIAAVRKRCMKARRTFTRRTVTKRTESTEQDANGDEEKRAAYQLARKELAVAITKAKNKKWQELIEEVDTDIWGTGWRIVRKKMSARIPMSEEAMAAEAERLFPTGNEPHRKLTIREGPPRPFGLEEIEKAGRRLKSGKAPGPDGIPSEVIKD